MAGEPALQHACLCNELTDSPLALQQKLQDAYPGGIAEPAEELGSEVGRGVFRRGEWGGAGCLHRHGFVLRDKHTV